MGNNLIDEIKKYDKQNVFGSVLSLPNQCSHAWEDANKVEIPESYKNIDNVVMCGMGGSGLGARVIDSLYFSEFKKPLLRINDYHLPSYVNNKTLVFVSSYSGNTEETINNLNEAIDKNAKIIAIGAGGKLIEIARNKNIPFYLINPTYNPSNQPRMAIGYSIIGQLVLASNAGLLDIKRSELDSAIKIMGEIIDNNDINKNSDITSLDFAHKTVGKIVLFVSAAHLVGATHVINNQLNENAKNLSYDFAIPELNHHLMEGLKHPKENSNNLLVFLFDSSLFSERIQQRIKITEEIVEKNNIETLIYKSNSPNKFSQVFEIIQMGAFLNFYSSMLYEQDPAPIPWVNYFKEKLGNYTGN